MSLIAFVALFLCFTIAQHDRVNDLVISANGISFENVDYSTAVQVLRECGNEVHLLIKRRMAGTFGHTSNGHTSGVTTNGSYGGIGMRGNLSALGTPASPTAATTTSADLFKVTLSKSKKKDDFGITLGCRIYVKELSSRLLMDRDNLGGLQEGDIVLKINNTSTENLTLKELRKLMDSNKEKLNLVVRRSLVGLASPTLKPLADGKENVNPMANGYGESLAVKNGWNNQNVYVQSPTRMAG